MYDVEKQMKYASRLMAQRDIFLRWGRQRWQYINVCVAPLMIVGVWLMEVVLQQLLEYYCCPNSEIYSVFCGYDPYLCATYSRGSYTYTQFLFISQVQRYRVTCRSSQQLCTQGSGCTCAYERLNQGNFQFQAQLNSTCINTRSS